MRTGLFVTHPITGAAIEVWVGNYVLMSYGDGAVMGVPAHDERDFAFAKKYGLPIRAGGGGRRRATSAPTAGTTGTPTSSAARCINSGNFDGLAYKAAVDAVAADLAAQGPGREEDHLAPARLGRQPPALLGHADPDHPLRRARRGAGARSRPAGRAARRLHPRRQRQPAEQARRLPGRAVPDLRRSRRGARPTRWTPSSIRRGTSCATATRRNAHAMVGDGARVLDADGPVHRRHRTRRSCTCCTRASGPR